MGEQPGRNRRALAALGTAPTEIGISNPVNGWKSVSLLDDSEFCE